VEESSLGMNPHRNFQTVDNFGITKEINAVNNIFTVLIEPLSTHIFFVFVTLSIFSNINSFNFVFMDLHKVYLSLNMF
jgi:hypothetical protein